MLGAIGPLHIIAFNFCSALVAELILWALIYRTPEFKTLNSNISKHTSLVDTAKEGSTGVGPNAVKKKEARLAALREETAKHVALVNFKTGVVVRRGEPWKRGGCAAGGGSGSVPLGSSLPPPPTCSVPAADHGDAAPQHEPDGASLCGTDRGAPAL